MFSLASVLLGASGVDDIYRFSGYMY